MPITPRLAFVSLTRTTSFSEVRNSLVARMRPPAAHELDVRVRAGGIPQVSRVFPIEGPTEGGSTLDATGINLGDVLGCEFGEDEASHRLAEERPKRSKSSHAERHASGGGSFGHQPSLWTGSRNTSPPYLEGPAR